MLLTTGTTGQRDETEDDFIVLGTHYLINTMKLDIICRYTVHKLSLVVTMVTFSIYISNQLTAGFLCVTLTTGDV